MSSVRSEGAATRAAGILGRLPAGSPVLVIGAGGLGCPAVLALAAAGVRRITIVDDDRVDASNIHRQVLHGVSAVGDFKVHSLARALRARHPEVEVTSHVGRFDAELAARLGIGAHAALIDASDNFATKFLANDAAVLAQVPLVHGAAVGLGGQMMTVRAGGRPCYRCLFEDIPAPGVGPSCTEAGVLGPVPGVIGALQGAEAARLVRGELPVFAGRIVQYDSASMSLRTVRVNPNPSCRVCGTHPDIRRLEASAYPAPACP